MLITSAERNKKNKDKLSVFIDGHYAFSIEEEDYLALSFYEEKEITQDEIEFVKKSVNLRSAKSKAIKFLLLKVRTEKEVRSKLDNEGFDAEIIENAIEDIKSMGYINDKIYTQKYIYDRSKLKPKAKKLLKYELLNKGISEEIIDEVLLDWEMDEETVAEGLIKRKFGKYDMKDEKVIKKMYSFLHHRGFGSDLILGIIKNIGRDA